MQSYPPSTYALLRIETQCNVTRYFVGGVTVRVRAHSPCFGGLVRGMSAFKWEWRLEKA